MKRDNKKALYESIMASVAKEVKKALNEDSNIIQFKPEGYKTLIIPNNLENCIQSLYNLISKCDLHGDERDMIEDICGALSTYYSLYEDLMNEKIKIVLK